MREAKNRTRREEKRKKETNSQSRPKAKLKLLNVVKIWSMNNEREMGAAKVTRKDFLNERGELKAENGHISSHLPAAAF
jgi:hypothetical protein